MMGCSIYSRLNIGRASGHIPCATEPSLPRIPSRAGPRGELQWDEMYGVGRGSAISIRRCDMYRLDDKEGRARRWVLCLMFLSFWSFVRCRKFWLCFTGGWLCFVVFAVGVSCDVVIVVGKTVRGGRCFLWCFFLRYIVGVQCIDESSTPDFDLSCLRPHKWRRSILLVVVMFVCEGWCGGW